MVLLGLLIPQVLSITRCAALACRVSYDIIIGHPAMSCNMDAKIQSGRIKIKKLENKAIDEEITSKFKNLHALAIEYAQVMADAGSFLSCTLVSVGRFAILKNLRFVRFLWTLM